MKGGRKFISIMLLSIVIIQACALSGCGVSDAVNLNEEYLPADMSGYEVLSKYDGQMRFADMTVKDIITLMEEKKSFAFIASFSECPWCNIVIPPLNDAALRGDRWIGLLNTRKDPAWTNNTEIDDYDLFEEAFGEYLPLDDDGRPHLYTPHLFVIKKGKIISEHQGALPEIENSYDEITEEQYSEMTEMFGGMLSLLDSK